MTKEVGSPRADLPGTTRSRPTPGGGPRVKTPGPLAPGGMGHGDPQGHPSAGRFALLEGV